MKKIRIRNEWIIVLILLLVFPFLTVKISADEEELFSLFRIQIRYINPVIIISLVFSQIWRVKKANGLTKSEILRSFIPFRKRKFST